MAKTGRNDPCHCGSGKKYKRCCLEKDDDAASAAAQARQAASVDRTSALLDVLEESLDPDFDGLDEATNSVVDMVRAGKLDEAEAAARGLLVRYPQVHDGYDRLGMVAEARGDKKLAAAHYRKILEFAQQHADQIDPRLIEGYRKMIDELDPPSGP
jgi:tetratricopeptide (TPR) repeat protein